MCLHGREEFLVGFDVIFFFRPQGELKRVRSQQLVITGYFDSSSSIDLVLLLG